MAAIRLSVRLVVTHMSAVAVGVGIATRQTDRLPHTTVHTHDSLLSLRASSATPLQSVAPDIKHAGIQSDRHAFTHAVG